MTEDEELGTGRRDDQAVDWWHLQETWPRLHSPDTGQDERGMASSRSAVSSTAQRRACSDPGDASTPYHDPPVGGRCSRARIVPAVTVSREEWSMQAHVGDQISIRARRLKDRIAYWIVDEYPGDEPTYNWRPRTSRQPLTLGDLIAMLDGARDCGGAVLGPVVFNIESCGGDADEYEDFVSVSSEFYPQLHDYYETRLAAYFDACRSADDDGMPDAAALASSKAIR